MKFYISAKWEQKEVVSKIIEMVVSNGHKVLVDWTKRAYARSYEDEKENSKNFAQEELKAILESDVFIHLSDGGGKGKYIDLGIALAGNLNNKKPKIFVVGEKANESQFYFHPNIKRISSNNILKSITNILKN
jgi:hypothetical protein